MDPIAEVAPNVYRIALYASDIDLQFNHFLVLDEEPLLFHTGPRGTFPALKDQVARLVNPARIRWIGFSHFESDECGALNQWLAAAPAAEPVCGLIGSAVNINDYSDRTPRVLTPDQSFSTGSLRFRFIPTPHVPHGWDAGVLFEETASTLFCSDLFHQWGEREPVTQGDILARAREALERAEASPFAGYVPYTHHTGRILTSLAQLRPKTLAVMHGSSFTGDCGAALSGLADVMRDVLGPKLGQAA